MQSQIALFKGFSVLDPIQLSTLSDVDVLTGLKGFTSATMQVLIQELPQLRHLAGLKAPLLANIPVKEQPNDLWNWWWMQQDALPNWFKLAKVAVLHQPSSAAIERFFPLIKGSTCKPQAAEDDDTIEARSMCRANRAIKAN